LNVLGHGGGIINNKIAVIMLFALAIAVCILPSAEWLNNQNTPQTPSNIVSTGEISVSHARTLNTQVNAASTYVIKYVTYKKVYKKVRYKYHGKYRYKWVVRYIKVYHYKKVVKAATKTVKKTSIIAYGVKVTAKTVIATAKCSCGALGNYNFHTATFQNYCPKCHKYGVLKWNPKGTPEGEWTCACGADYCAACGKIKIKGSNIHLIKA
jgi:hypothetical protein